MERILITGASGFIGTTLSNALENRGYEVRRLSRKKRPNYFNWNPSEGYIDPMVFENLDVIIHLAGAPISEKWTKKHKNEMYDSRIHTAHLLYKRAIEANAPIKTFITASGVNYYGTHTSYEIYREDDENAHDLLGQLCYEWEEAARSFQNLNSRICAVRTAAVLSPKGGMLKKLIPLAKMNLLSTLGNGKQILPWIHLDDLVQLYIHLLENKNLEGAYNAAADEIVDNREFTQKLVSSLHRKIWLPPTPDFALKLFLGEMSTLLLEGSAIDNQKIKADGFQFQFSELKVALNNLLN